MKIMNFKGRHNLPLLKELNICLSRKGFSEAIITDRPDMARWEKRTGTSLIVMLNVTLNPAMLPNTWTVEPSLVVRSTFAAELSNRLRLERGCCSPTDEWTEPTSLVVLSFNPAHIRWQEDVSLEYPTLKGRAETVSEMMDDFTDVCNKYIDPILATIGTPYDLAQFQMRALTGLKSTRLSLPQPRYKVIGEQIPIAMLLYEAGRLDLAMNLLAEVQMQKEIRSISMREVYARCFYCRVDKLMEFFKSVA